ncbi:FUSC family protein [Roseivirga sp.]|uniref:FUSC family protein n=1 Tax=Roseivirga sp. TaxID=1964215 RepID=UPI003B8C982F
MKPEELAQLSDEALLKEAGKIKSSPITDAFLIGFLIGILIFGAAASAWGFLGLLPLYLIFVFLKKGKKHSSLQQELKRRNLK